MLDTRRWILDARKWLNGSLVIHHSLITISFFLAFCKKTCPSIIRRMRTFGTKIGGFSALPIDLSAYAEMNKKIFIFL